MGQAILAAAEAELGRNPVEVFADSERTPLAAASTGQVHGARLEDGTRVVIKVRKPRVAETVTKRPGHPGGPGPPRCPGRIFGRDYDVEGLAAEFAWTLREELGYVRWELLAADSVRATISDGGITASMTFRFGADGRLLEERARHCCIGGDRLQTARLPP